MRFQHELITQIYFSVVGEDINGEPILGSDKTGALRMLIVPAAIKLPSVRVLTSIPRTYKDLTSRRCVCHSASVLPIEWIYLDVRLYSGSLLFARVVDPVAHLDRRTRCTGTDVGYTGANLRLLLCTRGSARLGRYGR